MSERVESPFQSPRGSFAENLPIVIMIPMSTDANPIFDAALAMPQALRADLAAKLLESLDPPPQVFSSDDPAFEAELKRRGQEMRNGAVSTYTIDETISAMREAVAKRRQV
jgi:hypothetical protein